MKIIHFIDEIKIGGAQTHLLTIVKEMLIQHPNDVHKIVVLFEDDSLSDKFREIGVEVECLNLRKYFRTKNIDSTYNAFIDRLNSTNATAKKVTDM